MNNRSLTVVFAVGAATIALVASSCTSADENTTETSSTASVFADVVVPEAFTSLTVTPIGDPTFPFLGTDQRYIAKLGNTGNANASHLHFQLMNGPTLLGSDGLPYVFDEFDYAEQVPVQAIMDADDYLTGNFLQDSLPAVQKRTNELPLNLAIVNFPES